MPSLWVHSCRFLDELACHEVARAYLLEGRVIRPAMVKVSKVRGAAGVEAAGESEQSP